MCKYGVGPAWSRPKKTAPQPAAGLLAFWLLAVCVCIAKAQAPAAASFTAPQLPDAPLPTSAAVLLALQEVPAQSRALDSDSAQTEAAVSQERPPSSQGAATLTGVVSDSSGGLIVGADVKLVSKDGQVSREEKSSNAGRYTFANLPPGAYTITLSSPGLSKVVLSDMPVTAAETFEAPQVPLPMARTTADVEVFAGQEQVAAAQLHIQEQQRVLGVFPNFYTSFIWDAAPLNRKQKFSLMFHATLDPVTFGTTALIAGGEQILNRFPAYGDGAEGYAKRYGAAYADGFIGRFLGAAVFPSLLGQDPRYFYQGTGTVRSRTYHAISSAIICRGDSGHRQLFYSHILGNFAAGGLANLYHPADDRGAGLTVSTALIGLGGSAGVNLIREFLLKPFTSKVPGYANGKPSNTALKQ